MKPKQCGNCKHWRQLSLGREYGTCEAPFPQWIWRSVKYTDRAEMRTSSDAESCEIFTDLKGVSLKKMSRLQPYAKFPAWKSETCIARMLACAGALRIHGFMTDLVLISVGDSPWVSR